MAQTQHRLAKSTNKKMNEPVSVTLLVVNVLERLGVRYLISGSFASTAYGRVRTTFDVDILADINSDHVDSFVAELVSEFYVDKVTVRKSIADGTGFNLIHFETMFKVDIFLPSKRPFDQNQLARREKRVIDRDSGSEAYFSTPEDIILAKLDWYRLGGEESDLQWLDVKAILSQQSDRLDFDYLKGNADAMDLADLLEQLLGETQN